MFVLSLSMVLLVVHIALATMGCSESPRRSDYRRWSPLIGLLAFLLSLPVYILDEAWFSVATNFLLLYFLSGIAYDVWIADTNSPLRYDPKSKTIIFLTHDGSLVTAINNISTCLYRSGILGNKKGS